MRLRLALFAVPLLAVALVPSAAQARHVRYYVSLGDSLSVGFQPNSKGHGRTTRQGYPDYLFKTEKRRFRGLRLVKMGCAGETTASISSNSAACAYGTYRNQLEAAEAFLRKHRKQIAFVTINIGANDIDGCVSSTGAIDFGCVGDGLNSVKRNVPKIAKRLRKAGGKRMQILGMTYYDPFLAFYLKGGSNQTIANASVGLAHQFNGSISSGYRGRKIKVVDVAKAFETDNTAMTTLAPFGSIPTNVARICQYTWMCNPPPVGPNIHANKTGYKLIAKTFAKRVRR
ncbi:MAG TPA: SGNH/GDSL hydrolase family protein [Thermoleophilaceae bacterium]|jgi:lysophospholipase L1-like esterase